jgi:hypothetical protein
MMDSYEDGNDTSGLTKREQLLNQINDYRLLDKDSAK